MKFALLNLDIAPIQPLDELEEYLSDSNSLWFSKATNYYNKNTKTLLSVLRGGTESTLYKTLKKFWKTSKTVF